MRLPGYVFHNVGSLVNDPKLDVIHGCIFHVTATNVSPLHYFDGPSQGIESTGYIPKSNANPKEQYRDTTREADANYKANSWIGTDGSRHGFLSFETQGLGSGSWTKYQLDEIKDVILVTHDEHGFPLHKCPSYHGYGVGYHTLFPEWSNVPGKTCPGPARIKQFNQIIVPWLAEQHNKFYVWKQGDTVKSVADKFNTTILNLWRLNPGSDLPFRTNDSVRVR